MGTNEKLSALAKEMGVTVSDLNVYATCLKVWIDKGYTVDRFLENAVALAGDAEFRAYVAGLVWDDVHAERSSGV